MRNNIISVTTDLIKEVNQGEFILAVSDWLNQDLPEAVMWFFNSNDGPTCRDNFLEIETFYTENTNSYAEAEYRLDELYLQILSLVHEGCDLVDNPKFLMFITDNRSE